MVMGTVKLAWNSFMNTVRHAERPSTLIMLYLSTSQIKGKGIFSNNNTSNNQPYFFYLPLIAASSGT